MLLALAMAAAVGSYAQETQEQIENAYPGYKLIFNDEFNYTGAPKSEYWGYDQGHRNNEAQGYTTNRKNANVKNGNLVISAFKEATTVNGKEYSYSSASIVSKVKQDPSQNRAGWKYVRIVVRAKIPCATGNWPAIWMLGSDPSWIAWPYSGEVDIMEYYPTNGKEALHANACWGDSYSQWGTKWDSKVKYVEDLAKTNSKWRDEYHVWRCDWDKDYIRIFCDEEQLNCIDLNKTSEWKVWWGDGNMEKNYNPFRDQPMYLLINLALGGNNGGSLDNFENPQRYYIDYVRVYSKDETQAPAVELPQGTNLINNGDFEKVDGATTETREDETVLTSFPGWTLDVDKYSVYAKTENNSKPDGTIIKEGNLHHLSLSRYKWNGYSDGAISQEVAVTPGHEYGFGFLYKLVYGKYYGPRPQCGFQVYDGGKDGELLLGNNDLGLTTSWQSPKGTFTPKSNKVLVRIFLTGNYKNWYDNSSYGKDPCWMDIEDVTLVDKSAATGITTVNAEKCDDPFYYTLDGRRLVRPHKAGVYIHQGKKIAIR